MIIQYPLYCHECIHLLFIIIFNFDINNVPINPISDNLFEDQQYIATTYICNLMSIRFYNIATYLCHVIHAPLCHVIHASLCHVIHTPLCHVIHTPLCHVIHASLCHVIHTPLCLVIPTLCITYVKLRNTP